MLHRTWLQDKTWTTLFNVTQVSQLKKELHTNPQLTRVQWRLLRQNKSGILLFPRAKLKVDCESLLLRFRTVIGGRAWGLEKRLPSSTSCRDV